MRTRRKLIWILLGCAIVAILLLMLLHEREPQFDGLSLSQWIAILERGNAQISREQAELAVRSIGTNALPFLLKWVDYQEPPSRRRLANLAGRLPGSLGDTAHALVFGRGLFRQQEALSALYVLGPDAKLAIPYLTQQLAGSYPEAAMSILAHIGDNSLATILPILTNKGPTALRCLAIEELEKSWTQFAATNVVQSALIGRLADSDREVAVYAAGFLASHKIDQERALHTMAAALDGADSHLQIVTSSKLTSSLYCGFSPLALVQYVQDTNSPYSERAARVLGGLVENRIPIPESIVLALTNGLHDPRKSVRLSTAEALSHFTQTADLVVPALLDARDDPDESVRSAATKTFFELPPYYHLASVIHWPMEMSQEQADWYARRYGTTPYSPGLTRLLAHPDIRIRQMATNVFRMLSGSNVVNQTSENANR
jgi:HEAT repeat protein